MKKSKTPTIHSSDGELMVTRVGEGGHLWELFDCGENIGFIKDGDMGSEMIDCISELINQVFKKGFAAGQKAKEADILHYAKLLQGIDNEKTA